MNSKRKMWNLRKKCNERAQKKDDWFGEWPGKRTPNICKRTGVVGEATVSAEGRGSYCLISSVQLIYSYSVILSLLWNVIKCVLVHGVVSDSCLRFAAAPYCFQWALTKFFCHRCCANVLYELFVLSRSCEIRSPFPQCVKQIKMKACFYGPAAVQIFGKKNKGKKKSCELTVGCCEDSLWSKHILSPKWWDSKF